MNASTHYERCVWIISLSMTFLDSLFSTDCLKFGMNSQNNKYPLVFLSRSEFGVFLISFVSVPSVLFLPEALFEGCFIG